MISLLAAAAAAVVVGLTMFATLSRWIARSLGTRVRLNAHRKSGGYGGRATHLCLVVCCIWKGGKTCSIRESISCVSKRESEPQ